ncbi:MAG: hypothetical protein GXX02_08100 [Syntrophomonadaceae bacterium]|jgi:hypothetical protein|nr:hypothetical protein [Syntrophomonadaceae bacterium]
MKIYHVCEICQQVFDTTEVDGYDEGSTEMRGMCEECSLEMGFAEMPLRSQKFFYN